MDNQGMALQVSLATAANINSLIATSATKLAFIETTPKLFLAVTAIPKTLKLAEGTGNLQDNEIILGAEEAAMMKKEKLITGPGDRLTNFLGLASVKIVGILEPTGTIIDKYHLVNATTLAKLPGVATLNYVAEQEAIKVFYVVTETNAPARFQSNMRDWTVLSWHSQNYQPIYIGSSEAKMMLTKKLFSRVGDTIDNFFGNAVVIAGILPETKTSLDIMHFVGPGFVFKN
jgi:hypothetical protein